MPLDIVVLDEGHLLDGGLDWGEVAALGRLTVYPRTAVADIPARAAGAGVVLLNKTPLDSGTLAKLPRLGLVSVLATGHNVVDTAAAAARGVTVCNVPGYATSSVAQHVFALILELCNRAGMHAAAVARGHWASSGEWCAPLCTVTQLEGKRLGLIGRGSIAQEVAAIGRAFGMECSMASTSHPEGGPGLAPLDEVVSTSDILSLHCKLEPATAGMVDAAFLRRMKRTALLVNTARGGLVNEADLLEALCGGVIAGAALDVLVQEPPPAGHPLCELTNCIITPHMAWMGVDARRRLVSITAGNIRAWLDGCPQNVVSQGISTA